MLSGSHASSLPPLLAPMELPYPPPPPNQHQCVVTNIPQSQRNSPKLYFCKFFWIKIQKERNGVVPPPPKAGKNRRNFIFKYGTLLLGWVQWLKGRGEMEITLPPPPPSGKCHPGNSPMGHVCASAVSLWFAFLRLKSLLVPDKYRKREKGGFSLPHTPIPSCLDAIPISCWTSLPLRWFKALHFLYITLQMVNYINLLCFSKGKLFIVRHF